MDVLWHNGTNQNQNFSIMFAHKLQFDNVELDAKQETTNAILSINM